MDRRRRGHGVRRRGLAAADVRPHQRTDQGLNGPDGRALARAYAVEVVEPLLARELPDVPLATARLGSGSDVLGYDDDTSRDHDWGLRLTLLVPDEHVAEVDAVLEAGLPETWRDLPTRFATTWEPTVRQRVDVSSPLAFTHSRTGLTLDHDPTTVEWLSLTGQAVLEVVGGPVFRDDTGELTAIRERLAWYPDDVARLAEAADWHRIAEELPFVGRADDLGSRIITARLVRTAMHLAFLRARRWPPYSKWLGTAFASLPGVEDVADALGRALRADDWRDREQALADALDALAGEPATQPFFDRPYRGLREDLGARRVLGTIEQWCDDVALLTNAELRIAAVRATWEAS